ncbi:MAG TPA: hypothetical protein VGR24_03550 [bacterium]|nr:hypothetical protein [bacterium]
MRAKLAEREQAVALRRQGLSYAEIQARVPVSQSSLSLWLRHVPLTADQQQRLADLRSVGTSSGPFKLHEEKVARMGTVRRKASREANRFLKNRDMFWIIGTTLYWAEGSKGKPWDASRQVCLTNMDPNMLRLFRQWIFRYGGVGPSDLQYALYIHPSADIEGARTFWMEELAIKSSTLRTYFKRPNHSPRRKNTGRHYHGTMRIRIARSTAFLWRVEQWIESLARVAGSAKWQASTL